MLYAVKKIYGPVVQGEGLNAGRACYMVRLAGCNMWDGRAETKAQSICSFCDTDFVGGTKMTALQIQEELVRLGFQYNAHGVIVSGGEPALQISRNPDLVNMLSTGFAAWVDIETNGSVPLIVNTSFNVHVSCSPKVKPDMVRIIRPSWWKILVPNWEVWLPHLAKYPSQLVFLQPVCEDGLDGSKYLANVKRCLELQRVYPEFRLSLQLHKYLGIE